MGANLHTEASSGLHFLPKCLPTNDIMASDVLDSGPPREAWNQTRGVWGRYNLAFTHRYTQKNELGGEKNISVCCRNTDPQLQCTPCMDFFWLKGFCQTGELEPLCLSRETVSHAGFAFCKHQLKAFPGWGER